MYTMELRDVYAVRNRIDSLIKKTPLEPSLFLSEKCGGEVWLKLENQQLTGSFKVRGALNRLLKINHDEKERGIVTASSGNHAQGIGYAAQILGLKATIVVPTHTPRVKLDAIRRYGVELVMYGSEYMDAERRARQMEKEESMPFISGYNDLDIIAGQGTVGLEMVESMPDLDVVLVPVGGGGLISGVACVLKTINRDIKVVGVQSVASPVMCESVKQGHIVEMELENSVAEGLHGGIEEGSVTFEMCRDLVDDFVLVREETIVKAIWLLLTQQHQVVEGAGAVGAAAIMENPQWFRNRRVGVVISGGNLDTKLLQEAVQS